MRDHRVSVDARMLTKSRTRYMGLNDLMTEVKADSHNFTGDEATEMKVLKQVMALVQDKISEVKNQAVKWCVIQLIMQLGNSRRASAWVSSSKSLTITK